MKAVIMAGGEGTRLRPLTCNLPKPMVPILNRPMMEHIINLLKKHEITDIANTLWYLPNDVTAYFGDGSRFGVSMNYYVEDKPLGTAGSVKNACEFLDETFVVVSGDSLTDIDLTQAVQFHRAKNAVATLVLTRVSNPLNYGVVITDEMGRIVQFLEKPSWSQVFSDTVNTGIYVLEPEVLGLFKKGDNFDFSRDLFPRLLESGAPMYGYAAEGYWSDVGSLEVYHRAQQDCLDGKVQIQLPEARSPGVYIEDEVVIADGAEILGPVSVGRGARISNGVFLGPYSVIGPYVQVDIGASIKRSTLWSGVQVGPGCQLRGCICAKNVHLQEKVHAYEGVVLGEKTTVGAESTLIPNTKVWPEKNLPSGTTLRKSLVWGSQERSALFSKIGISGDIRGQMTPENIVQAGLSYAAFIGQGKKVLVTADSSAISRVGKRALISGLLSGGTNVLDGGTVAGNLTRFAVQILGLDGALHCEMISGRTNHINIQCWTREGRFLSKSDQRRIENLFLREDFPRVGGDDLGELAFVPSLTEQYINTLAELYYNRHPDFKVRLHIKSEKDRELGALIQGFLERAGYTHPSPEETDILGVVVKDGKWFFLDEQGQPLDDNGWWDVFAQALRARAQTAMAVPIHMSQTIPQIASDNGLKVQWTKLEPLFWMETASELGNTDGDEVEVFPYIEPTASIGEVLRFLSSTKQKLSSVVSSNTTYRRSGRVLCPWKDKGRIMRELIRTSDPKRTVYLDGIKEHTPNGWALVIPDGDEPVFRIYSEADTPEEADGLVQCYSELIKSYFEEEER